MDKKTRKAILVLLAAGYTLRAPKGVRKMNKHVVAYHARKAGK